MVFREQTCSASSSFSFPHPSSSGHEETCLHRVFVRPAFFFTGKGSSLMFSFCRLPCFSQRTLRQFGFLPVGRLHPLFSSPFRLGEMFDLRWIRSIRSLIAFSLFWNWRQWAQTCSLQYCTCCSCRCNWSGWCWFMWEDSGKLEGETVHRLEEWASFHWKSPNCVVWMVGCMLKRSVGSCGLSSESPNTGYRVLGVRRIEIQL